MQFNTPTSSHDEDGNGRVIQRALGDAAEEQAPEAADPTGTDDEDTGSGFGNSIEQFVEGCARAR
jgi:hypothetical protein